MPLVCSYAMAQNSGATAQCVAQGRCTECGSNDDNYTVEKREVDIGWGVERILSCECGAGAIVTITSDGLLTERSITHEDASWNSEQ